MECYLITSVTFDIDMRASNGLMQLKLKQLWVGWGWRGTHCQIVNYAGTTPKSHLGLILQLQTAWLWHGWWVQEAISQLYRILSSLLLLQVVNMWREIITFNAGFLGVSSGNRSVSSLSPISENSKMFILIYIYICIWCCNENILMLCINVVLPQSFIFLYTVIFKRNRC